MDLISAKNNPPKIKYSYSEKDYLCITAYGYEVGRIKDGVWITMDNKKIEFPVVFYCELPVPTEEMYKKEME